ncbi:thioredoxin-dependent thiol peroxidase [Paenibacillus chibensis]|uniref:thioredoxin-dependent peroxiredoxin n=1 Tax=Paenibacillus chibensis TaxID=59846 RepID=A0ABU6PYZ5_9BACL|nr:thioredoxin-dependent thiol peroxidase [Paenibacillus chibensis]
MTELTIGQEVPDFTLPASNGEEITLSRLRGRKVVLYFYPKDMTPTCTDQACSFRDFHSAFEEKGVTVLGVSPDPVKSHGKFRDKHKLPFLLLSDEDHQVSESYGVWQLKKMYGREYMGIVRSTFLIDEEGKLLKEWRKVKVKGHTEDILSLL